MVTLRKREGTGGGTDDDTYEHITLGTISVGKASVGSCDPYASDRQTAPVYKPTDEEIEALRRILGVSSLAKDSISFTKEGKTLIVVRLSITDFNNLGPIYRRIERIFRYIPSDPSIPSDCAIQIPPAVCSDFTTDTATRHTIPDFFKQIQKIAPFNDFLTELKDNIIDKLDGELKEPDCFGRGYLPAHRKNQKYLALTELHTKMSEAINGEPKNPFALFNLKIRQDLVRELLDTYPADRETGEYQILKGWFSGWSIWKPFTFTNRTRKFLAAMCGGEDE